MLGYGKARHSARQHSISNVLTVLTGSYSSLTIIGSLPTAARSLTETVSNGYAAGVSDISTEHIPVVSKNVKIYSLRSSVTQYRRMILILLKLTVTVKLQRFSKLSDYNTYRSKNNVSCLSNPLQILSHSLIYHSIKNLSRIILVLL